MPFHYIYKTTCKETGEYYIGKRSCSMHWSVDPYMGSGTILQRKMNKHPEYRWEKEVLVLFRSASEAYKWENIAIGSRHRGGSSYDGLCLNVIPGGVESRRRPRSAMLKSPDGQVKTVEFENIVSFLKSGYTFKARSVKLYNNETRTVHQFFGKAGKHALVTYPDTWEFGIPFDVENPEILPTPDYLKDDNFTLLKKGINLVKDNQIELVDRIEIIQKLKDGYDFNSSALYIHNPSRGVFCRVTSGTAKRLLTTTDDWFYGNPTHAGHKRITAKDI